MKNNIERENHPNESESWYCPQIAKQNISSNVKAH
jgi:hypothetical protein